MRMVFVEIGFDIRFLGEIASKNRNFSICYDPKDKVTMIVLLKGMMARDLSLFKK
jgi:hypothetical protein